MNEKIEKIKRITRQKMAKALRMKEVFMLARRGNWYGPFGNWENAVEFGEWKDYKDKKVNTKGIVHKMSLWEVVDNLDSYLKKQEEK